MIIYYYATFYKWTVANTYSIDYDIKELSSTADDDHVSNTVNSSLFIINVVPSNRKLNNITRYIYIWWVPVGDLSGNVSKRY